MLTHCFHWPLVLDHPRPSLSLSLSKAPFLFFATHHYRFYHNRNKMYHLYHNRNKIYHLALSAAYFYFYFSPHSTNVAFCPFGCLPRWERALLFEMPLAMSRGLSKVGYLDPCLIECSFPFLFVSWITPKYPHPCLPATEKEKKNLFCDFFWSLIRFFVFISASLSIRLESIPSCLEGHPPRDV